MSPSAVTDVSPAGTTSENPKPKEQHVHGGEGMTSLQAMSHGDVALPGIPNFTSLEKQRQWQLEHMACAFRTWSRHGFVEGMSGHISVRDPEHIDAFWTNPLGVHFGLLKASDMILVKLDGTVIGGNTSRPANAAGFLIHAAVHEARPDVHAVCHAHTIYGKAWSSFARPLEMLNQDVCKFFGAHSVYNSYGGVVLAAEEGKLIAKSLAQGKAAILMNHGLLTVGGTVDEAAYLFGLMERSCRIQLLTESAAANGIPKVLISDEEAAYNFKIESEPESLYCEFQAEYDYEDVMCNGDFKK
ncbi:hypothetical protein AJ80_09344 [Polytolypa hystricis UAMH7299]|uniref:Class II aldolase/adducin N-terminal domain-containing protein n=1 Tax=Polytolypa hystricis (strain UAMH7299) TaxID=1447883 RepID=A0A2B7WSB2_POLH7|nr:hypothetical protein AJ80_09344 [Polytolypa hystricis UAMH7299]